MSLKGPEGFGRWMNIIMNVIVCTVLSLYVLYAIQNMPGNEQIPIFTGMGFAVSFVQSFFIGMVVGDYLPALTWGQKLAGALKISNKLLAHIVSVFVLALVMTVCISLICLWLNNIQSLGLAIVAGMWVGIYPLLFVIGYATLLVTLPPAMKLAAVLSGFDPSKARHEA